MDTTDLEFILAQWQALTLEERRELYEMPCTGSDSRHSFGNGVVSDFSHYWSTTTEVVTTIV